MNPIRRTCVEPGCELPARSRYAYRCEAHNRERRRLQKRTRVRVALGAPRRMCIVCGRTRVDMAQSLYCHACRLLVRTDRQKNRNLSERTARRDAYRRMMRAMLASMQEIVRRDEYGQSDLAKLRSYGRLLADARVTPPGHSHAQKNEEAA